VCGANLKHPASAGFGAHMVLAAYLDPYGHLSIDAVGYHDERRIHAGVALDPDQAVTLAHQLLTLAHQLRAEIAE
jgi:hypothetical protein